jgi:basic membrane protein A
LRGGLREGFVKMSPYGASVTPAARNDADAIKARMVAGQFVIFKGPLKDNKGGEAIAAGTNHPQTDYLLKSMNYLVAGVVGQM